MRLPNRTVEGRQFSTSIIDAVWEKAWPVTGYDPNLWRRDKCGALIRKFYFGDIESQFGWEIDHVKPVSEGGSDALINLEPMQWENNRHKGDNWPSWECKIKG
ncbi:MAG: HNH endonuclease [Bacteroidetes bacterium]|jgi:5-methylcytosine-specific restriction endonuclease McrA|nr:HNH endonuclease [Bacteroidota bacterium]MCL5033822.1 HNH endonuclease [Bacteroidota bacterium]